MTTTFDFQDGNGPVPAHRHPNGGGWVADTATVEETAFVGPDARVSGSALVEGGVQLLGDTRISGVSCVMTYNPLNVSKVAPSKVYALISNSDDTLQGIFATELGAEQSRGKRRTRTTIEDWEVEP